jgi:hypothetical protein
MMPASIDTTAGVHAVPKHSTCVAHTYYMHMHMRCCAPVCPRSPDGSKQCNIVRPCACCGLVLIGACSCSKGLVVLDCISASQGTLPDRFRLWLSFASCML